ncbi:repressor LexA [Candidatus Daviesbacteria bacterium]|nr:repressor LexA [Candidatus Daviesbacteria bacterium]
MQYLPSKTEKVLQTLIQFQNKNGYSPSITELKTIVGNKSTRGIVLQLDKLQKLGYIQREKNSRRAIKILRKPIKINKETMINVPVLGEIRAGYGSLAEQNIEGYEKIPLLLAKGQRDVFILRVKGTSMLKAGINPGDLAIIAPQNNANNGDIVIAFDPDDETATLKRFKRLQDYVMLLPESDDPSYQPKIGKQFVIQGKFIDLLRKN